MTLSKIIISAWLLIASGLLTACSGAEPSQILSEPPQTAGITQAEAEAIFDYAYPLVIMKISNDLMLTVPFRARTSPNHFIHFSKLAQPEQRAVVLGNRNTLYSVGWIDLSAGPVVFEIPDMGDRYYVMPLLDAWTNTFRSLGSRTTGSQAQKYFIVNQAWEGDAPEGYKTIISPTNMVWITGRIQADSAEDAKEAAKLQDAYKLMTYEEMQTGTNPFVDFEEQFKPLKVRRPVPYSLKMDADKFYDTFLDMWAHNPSPPEDAAMLAVMEKAGLKPDVSNFSDLSDVNKAQLTKGLKAKQTAHTKAFYDGTEQTTPWIFNLDPNMGDWDTEYERRAYWAMWGLGTNITKDAVYGVTQLDADLQPLNGATTYKMHFEADETPPTNAFWSVTNYDIEGYLERNEQDRYSLGSNHKLSYNEDGSLDFYLSNEAPTNPDLNWVPAPEGDFKTLLRIYWPESDVLRGEWDLPILKKVTD